MWAHLRISTLSPSSSQPWCHLRSLSYTASKWRGKSFHCSDQLHQSRYAAHRLAALSPWKELVGRVVCTWVLVAREHSQRYLTQHLYWYYQWNPRPCGRWPSSPSYALKSSHTCSLWANHGGSSVHTPSLGCGSWLSPRPVWTSAKGSDSCIIGAVLLSCLGRSMLNPKSSSDRKFRTFPLWKRVGMNCSPTSWIRHYPSRS